MNRLVIIGAGGHGKVIADIACLNGYREIIFLDDDSNKTNCGAYAVEGGVDTLGSYGECDCFVAVGNPYIRERITKTIDAGRLITLIHPDAIVAQNVKPGKGTVIMAGAVINPDTVIGEGCIINTCSSVDHDNRIGNYVHVAVGAHLCGAVSVEDRTWVGAGAIVSNNITVCSDCIIGAGTVVIKDIDEPGTYIGVPAQKIK